LLSEGATFMFFASLNQDTLNFEDKPELIEHKGYSQLFLNFNHTGKLMIGSVYEVFPCKNIV